MKLLKDVCETGRMGTTSRGGLCAEAYSSAEPSDALLSSQHCVSSLCLGNGMEDIFSSSFGGSIFLVRQIL